MTGPIVVVVNGAFAHEKRLDRVLEDASYVIAADGGANWLASRSRRPDLLVGDMDSVCPELLVALERDGCAIQRYSTHKDETDTELALLSAVKRGAGEGVTSIIVLGALGGRIDHELANVMSLTMPKLEGACVTIFDGVSYMTLIRDEIEIVGNPGDLVSLIPLGGPVEGITTSGLEYPLDGEALYVGPARGVSNVLLGRKAHVRLAKGMLLMIHTPLENLDEENAR